MYHSLPPYPFVTYLLNNAIVYYVSLHFDVSKKEDPGCEERTRYDEEYETKIWGELSDDNDDMSFFFLFCSSVSHEQVCHA